MKVLVCNVGSTSLKFKLFSMPEARVMCEARIERVGSMTQARYLYRNCEKGLVIQKDNKSVPDYAEGVRMFLSSLLNPSDGVLCDIGELEAVGFKTVLSRGHYGVHELTEEVMQGMEDCLLVAPAHNAPYLEVIRNFRSLVPDARLVGVFETAFHGTIPLERKLYGIPYEWYERYGIMRMGYHGASHGHVARLLERELGSTGRTVSCHLGGSGSICAILDGKSVDNSFGFSLQTGLPHAYRCGDLDPYVVPYLMKEGLSMARILEGLSRESGLLGISGVSSDLRDIESACAEGNQRAKLAVDVYVCAIVRYIGAYYAELGGLDNLVFTGGVGENSAMVRELVCGQLGHMGVHLDAGLNHGEAAGERRISSAGSPVAVYVFPADEESGIADQTYRCVQGTPS